MSVVVACRQAQFIGYWVENMDKQQNIDQIEQYFSTTKRGEIYARVIGDMERLLIEQALRRSAGNQLAAAKILGINRNTLHSKIKKMHINVKRFKQ